MVAFEQPDTADFAGIATNIICWRCIGRIGFTLQLVAQRYTNAPAAALILSLNLYLQPGLGGGCLANIGPDWHTRLCADFCHNHRRWCRKTFPTKMMRQFFGFWHKDR